MSRNFWKKISDPPKYASKNIFFSLITYVELCTDKQAKLTLFKRKVSIIENNLQLRGLALDSFKKKFFLKN